jgi:hypothetical protein
MPSLTAAGSCLLRIKNQADEFASGGNRMRFAEMDEWRDQWASFLAFLILETLLIGALFLL